MSWPLSDFSIVRLCTSVIVSRPISFVIVSTTFWHTRPRSASSVNSLIGPCFTARFICSSDGGAWEETSCSISPSIASSSATALVATDRLRWDTLRNDFVIRGYAIRGRHCWSSCALTGLLHLELAEKENSDLATEDGPLRAMFNIVQ